MYVNTNVAALNSWQNLYQTQQSLTGVLQQLSSGNRINSAANDPAGMAISQEMLSQINGMQQASQNAQSGISLLQTADGALGQIQNILQSMHSLASEAASGTMNANDTAALQSEMNQYAQEITSITNQTSFNTINLLGGTLQNESVQIGPDKGQTLSISLAAADAYSLGITGQTANLITAGDLGSIASGSGLTAGTTYTLSATVTPWSVSTITGTTGDFYSLKGNAINLTTADSFTVTVVSAGSSSSFEQIKLKDNATGITTAYSAQSASTNGSFVVTVAGQTFTLATTAAGSGDTFTVSLDPTQTVVNLSDGTTSASTTYTGLLQTGTTETATIGSGGQVLFTLGSTLAGETAATYTATTMAGTGPSPSALTSAVFVWQQDGAAATGTNGTLTTSATATNAVDITTQSDAQSALSVLTNAINQISTERGNVGAYQNRLQFAASDLQTSQQNLQSARAGITNADMAMDMSKLTQYQILQQSGVAMLAQADAMPQALLKLIA